MLKIAARKSWKAALAATFLAWTGAYAGNSISSKPVPSLPAIMFTIKPGKTAAMRGLNSSLFKSPSQGPLPASAVDKVRDAARKLRKQGALVAISQGDTVAVLPKILEGDSKVAIIALTGKADARLLQITQEIAAQVQDHLRKGDPTAAHETLNRYFDASFKPGAVDAPGLWAEQGLEKSLSFHHGVSPGHQALLKKAFRENEAVVADFFQRNFARRGLFVPEFFVMEDSTVRSRAQGASGLSYRLAISRKGSPRSQVAYTVNDLTIKALVRRDGELLLNVSAWPSSSRPWPIVDALDDELRLLGAEARVESVHDPRSLALTALRVVFPSGKMYRKALPLFRQDSLGALRYGEIQDGFPVLPFIADGPGRPRWATEAARKNHEADRRASAAALALERAIDEALDHNTSKTEVQIKRGRVRGLVAEVVVYDPEYDPEEEDESDDWAMKAVEEILAKGPGGELTYKGYPVSLSMETSSQDEDEEDEEEQD